MSHRVDNESSKSGSFSDELLDDHFSFKTTSFVRHDTLLSIIYFSALIALPHLIWQDANPTLLKTWLVIMLALTASRWVVRGFFNHVQTDLMAGHISTVIMALTLLDGLGWGLAGALFFPETASGIYLTATLLIGMAGVGAAAYSSRMLVAIPYLFCVISPFVLRLVQLPENEYLILAIVMGLLCGVFCFVADKINITLQDALAKHSDQRETHDLLRSDMRYLKSQLMEMDNQRLHQQNHFQQQTSELEALRNVMLSYDEELDKLEVISVNLRDELDLFDIEQPKEQLQINLDRLKGQANDLVDHLQSDEPIALLDVASTHALPKPENEGISESRSEFETTPTKPALIEQSKNIDVLIVNDDPQEKQKIEACCRSREYAYQSVSSVPEALSMLCDYSASDQRFNLIICKRELPDMDGIGFAQCLSDDQEYRQLPFLLIGQNRLDDPQQNVMEANLPNIVDCIARPLDLLALERGVTNALNASISALPMAVQATVSDSHAMSVNADQDDDGKGIDYFVLDGLRVSTNHRFVEIVNTFLEDGPTLITQARSAYKANDIDGFSSRIQELGQRSLHMGALDIMDRCNEIDDLIQQESSRERIVGMLHFLEADFIEIESVLLAELTKESTLDETFLNSSQLRRDS